MRDIKRIARFCEMLREIWEMYPDMRFGQLICNIFEVYYVKTKRDPFFPEDEEFFKELMDIAKNGLK